MAATGRRGDYVHYTTLQDQGCTTGWANPGRKSEKGKEVKTEKDDLDGMDIDLVENLRKKSMARDKSQGWAGKGLFPLTTNSSQSICSSSKGGRR